MLAALAAHAKQESGTQRILWIIVCGGVASMLSSLPNLEENLIGREVAVCQCCNPKNLVAALKLALNEGQRGCLLCRCNADHKHVRGLSNELCVIARPLKASEPNFWVLVTSTRGEPRIWTRFRDWKRMILTITLL